eukprot:TRINITY_DN16642_c0_g1_i1.p1 TRINITY_DN16642_c0_g1~~TRINITY_DN16642_c0_g1_i1.p1  ORF type:complete len:290 (-),score=77.54 TRINITY_DN16642_c0_g1_i1:80-949(-)
MASSSSGAASSSSAAPPANVETLPCIGDAPHNDYALRPLDDSLTSAGVPSAGYIGKLAKSAPAFSLRDALAAALGVPPEGISVAHEGKDLDYNRTLKDNGVVEPGPSARRAGARIGLVFVVHQGFELASVREQRDAEEQKKKAEEAERLAEENAKKEAAQRKKDEEEAARQEALRNAAILADACTLRCRPVDGGGEGAELRTRLSATVEEVATAISREMGMQLVAGRLTLIYNNVVLPRERTLAQCRVVDRATILFYWEDVAEGAAQQEERDAPLPAPGDDGRAVPLDD